MCLPTIAGHCNTVFWPENLNLLSDQANSIKLNNTDLLHSLNTLMFNEHCSYSSVQNALISQFKQKLAFGLGDHLMQVVAVYLVFHNNRGNRSRSGILLQPMHNRVQWTLFIPFRSDQFYKTICLHVHRFIFSSLPANSPVFVLDLIRDSILDLLVNCRAHCAIPAGCPRDITQSVRPMGSIE